MAIDASSKMFHATRCLPVLFLAWAANVSASPVPAEDSLWHLPALGSTYHTSDISSLLNESRIPEEFNIEATVFRGRDDPDAFFYVTIMALAQMASLDFSSPTPGQEFRNDRYPRLPIDLAVNPSHTREGRMPTRYVIWGLTLAISYMTKFGFGTSRYSLKWEDRTIGSLGFGIPRRIRDADALSRDLAITNTTTMLESTAAANFPDDSTPELDIDFRYAPGSTVQLGKISVWYAIIGTLGDVAPKPISARINSNYGFSWDDAQAQFRSRPMRRLNPPYYRWGHVIGSLARATEYLAEHDDYRPLNMNVKVDDVSVAVSQILEKDRDV
ncbi:MAG: hypothetical protein Q9174_007145, partial [Haloplaca sp. 1 TL-2023]